MGRRLGDIVLVACFAAFLIISLTIDTVNVAIPGPISAESTLVGLSWPPKWAVGAIVRWCSMADPMLCENPLWLRIAAAYSPFLYAPFYVLAIYAFLFQRNWIRGPCIAWAAHLLNTMTLLTGEAVYGATPSHNVAVFAAGYAPYALAPLYVLCRCIFSDALFPSSRAGAGHTLQRTVLRRDARGSLKTKDV